jgi:hypothetical protein
MAEIAAENASQPPDVRARYAAMDETRAAYVKEAKLRATMVRLLHGDLPESKGPPEAVVAIDAILDAIALDQLASEAAECRPSTWQESLEHLGIFNQAALDKRKDEFRKGGKH